jgi:hypothetical protein
VLINKKNYRISCNAHENIKADSTPFFNTNKAVFQREKIQLIVTATTRGKAE